MELFAREKRRILAMSVGIKVVLVDVVHGAALELTSRVRCSMLDARCKPCQMPNSLQESWVR